jgi:hypothetical protein
MIWLNDGNGHFTNSNWALPGIFVVNVAVGDVFNHGRNDIVMTGSGGANGGPGTEEAFILRNDGNGVFTRVDYGLFRVTSPAFPGVAVADYDNDGRLDFAIVGGAQALNYPLTPNPSTLYRNLLDIPVNQPPAAPTGLSSRVGPGRVDLSWGAATDAITPGNQLTYNVRIGTSSLGTQIVSPLANITTGWRKVAARGNVGPCPGTCWKLPPGTYFWSVQAIDGAYAGGAWGAEQMFTIVDPEVPELHMAPGTPGPRVRWPSRFPDWKLESSTTLAPGSWTEIPGPYPSVNGSLEISAGTGVRDFFRLRRTE